MTRRNASTTRNRNPRTKGAARKLRATKPQNERPRGITLAELRNLAPIVAQAAQAADDFRETVNQFPAKAKKRTPAASASQRAAA